MFRIHWLPVILFSSVLKESGKIRASVALFGIPAAVGLCSYLLGFRIHQASLKSIVTSMTLFVGFSMNAVVLMLRYAESSDANPDLIEQVRNIAVYLVTLGIILVFIALIGIVTVKNSQLEAVGRGESALYYSLLIHFFTVALLFPTRIFTVVEQIGKGGSSTEESDSGNVNEPSTSRDRSAKFA